MSTQQIKLKNLMLNFIFKKKFKMFGVGDKLLALHMEVLNKLWYFQWKVEWDLAFAKLTEYKRIHRKKKFKLGVYFSKKNKALNFIPRKQSLNKKKVIIPTDQYNIGFYFYFTSRLKKALLTGKLVK